MTGYTVQTLVSTSTFILSTPVPSRNLELHPATEILQELVTSEASLSSPTFGPTLYAVTPTYPVTSSLRVVTGPAARPFPGRL